jgi:hypothetical protein
LMVVLSMTYKLVENSSVSCFKEDLYDLISYG